MTTKIFYFSGPCKWAKLQTPDSYNGQDRWKIDLYLTKKDLKILEESGSKVKIKEDDDGKFVSFSRKTTMEVKGEVQDLGPPMVIDKDKQPFDKEIGNGSLVTCKVAIYDTRMGKGTRLEAVRVDEWKEYVPQSGEGEF